MGSRKWTNDLRIVKPILEMNGYYAENNGHSCVGSHTKFVNAKGNSISVPKSINRMLWRGIVRRNNLVGALGIVNQLKG